MSVTRREQSGPPSVAAGAAASEGRTEGAAPALERRDPFRDVLLRRLVATADVTAVLASGAVAGALAEQSLATALWWVALLPFWVMVAKLHGLYDEDHVRIRHLTSDELPRLFHWATVSAAGAGLALTLGPLALSAETVLAAWAVALVVSLSLRYLARFAWMRLVSAERCVVVGEGQLADALRRKLALETGHHVQLVASLLAPPAPAEDDAGSAARQPLPELERTIRAEGAERVVLAMPDLDEATLARVVATCRAHGVKLSVAPPLRAMLGTAVRLTHLAELSVIEFRTWDPSRSTAFLKRTMDVTIAGAGLIVLSPLLLLIGLLVSVGSRGPALFRQRRAGQGGLPFQLFKFRTMVRDAEQRLDALVRVDELEEPMFKLREDPRVTRVGRLLRATSLDELPQLVNVLRGEMSLVGPRPEEVRLVERYSPELRFRLEVRPGMTGPMQVHGRGELTFQERVAVEREYIENYSLQKDIKILIATGTAVARRRGAY